MVINVFMISYRSFKYYRQYKQKINFYFNDCLTGKYVNDLLQQPEIDFATMSDIIYNKNSSMISENDFIKLREKFLAQPSQDLQEYNTINAEVLQYDNYLTVTTFWESGILSDSDFAAIKKTFLNNQELTASDYQDLLNFVATNELSFSTYELALIKQNFMKNTDFLGENSVKILKELLEAGSLSQTEYAAKIQHINDKKMRLRGKLVKNIVYFCALCVVIAIGVILYNNSTTPH